MGDPLIDAETSRLLASALRARMLMRARYTRRYIGEIWTRVKRALIDSRLARSTARPVIPRHRRHSIALLPRPSLFLSALSFTFLVYRDVCFSNEFPEPG